MRGHRQRLPAGRRRPEQREILAEVQRHPAGVPPQRARADPHELATRAQLVHPGRRIGADAAGQHVALPHLGGQRESLERDEDLTQAVDARAGGRVAVDALPAGQEAGERALVGGLDLLAQDGERGAPQAPEHLGVAPLAFAAPGAELATHKLAGALELAQHRAHVDAVAGVQLTAGERPVGGGVAPRDPAERVGNVLEEGGWETPGRDDSEAIAIEPGVGGGDEALLAADPHPHRAALADELLEHRVGLEAIENPGLRLSQGEVTERAEDVVERVARGRASVVGEALQVGLDLVERRRVDEVAQLLLPEQLAQQVTVER